MKEIYAYKMMILLSIGLFGLIGCNGNPLTSSSSEGASAVVVAPSDPVAGQEPVVGGGGQTSALNSATLSWVGPVEKENGESLASNELAGFQIYYGTSGNPYENVINIDSPYSTSYTINDLPAGVYTFCIVAVDNAGRTSTFSNYITKSIS